MPAPISWMSCRFASVWPCELTVTNVLCSTQRRRTWLAWSPAVSDEKCLVSAHGDPPMRVLLAAARVERVSAPLDDEVGDGGIHQALRLEDEAIAEGAPFLRLHLGAAERGRNLAANRSGRRWKPHRTGHCKAEGRGGPPASP